MFGVSQAEGKVVLREVQTGRQQVLAPLTARLRAGLLARDAENAADRGEQQVDAVAVLLHQDGEKIAVIEALALAAELFHAGCQAVAAEAQVFQVAQ